MKRKLVSSSLISSVGWENNVLEVQFKDDEIYQYRNVSRPEYKNFLYMIRWKRNEKTSLSDTAVFPLGRTSTTRRHSIHRLAARKPLDYEPKL